MKTYIALLRGINVGGHNKIPMGDLRSLCEDIGWEAVKSYIQSGNIVFRSVALFQGWIGSLKTVSGRARQGRGLARDDP